MTERKWSKTPPMVPKDVVCRRCQKPGGTLVKLNDDGLYVHQKFCPNPKAR